MHIKANKALFDEFQRLSTDVRLMSTIVQNDQEIEPGDMTRFCNRSLELRNALGGLTDAVLDYVVKERTVDS